MTDKAEDVRRGLEFLLTVPDSTRRLDRPGMGEVEAFGILRELTPWFNARDYRVFIGIIATSRLSPTGGWTFFVV